MKKPTQIEIAEKVQKASIEAAREGFKEASLSGLCGEGAMEAAIGAIQSLDLKRLVEKNSSKEEG
ncbi:MAG TPA: acetyltransferase [Balneolaceae bacterium]